MSNFMLLAEVGTAAGFCNDSANIWQVVGYLLLVFKIVIPIILIIYGMIDLGKAVVASKDDEIKKAAKSLGMRILAGVIIFFVPTIVGFAFTLADGFNSDGDYSICEACITNPNGC